MMSTTYHAICCRTHERSHRYEYTPLCTKYMHEMIAALALARQGCDSSRATVSLGSVQLVSFARVRHLRFLQRLTLPRQHTASINASRPDSSRGGT